MTLKEMIEEARMMAETPDLDTVRDSEEDGIQESEFEYSSRKTERSRVAKSPSEYSYTESVVSVIEKPYTRGSPSMPGNSISFEKWIKTIYSNMEKVFFFFVSIHSFFIHLLGLTNGHNNEYENDDIDKSVMNQKPRFSERVENEKASPLPPPKPPITIAGKAYME